MRDIRQRASWDTESRWSNPLLNTKQSRLCLRLVKDTHSFDSHNICRVMMQPEKYSLSYLLKVLSTHGTFLTWCIFLYMQGTLELRPERAPLSFSRRKDSHGQEFFPCKTKAAVSGEYTRVRSATEGKVKED